MSSVLAKGGLFLFSCEAFPDELFELCENTKTGTVPSGFSIAILDRVTNTNGSMSKPRHTANLFNLNSNKVLHFSYTRVQVVLASKSVTNMLQMTIKKKPRNFPRLGTQSNKSEQRLVELVHLVEDGTVTALLEPLDTSVRDAFFHLERELERTNLVMYAMDDERLDGDFR